MTTTNKLRKDLRALWERAEAVGLLRETAGGHELDTAITCRNDAILSIELAFSALQSENARLKALVEKLDREVTPAPSSKNTSDPTKLTATIGRNTYGGYFVWLRGQHDSTVQNLPGFVRQTRAAEDALDALVEKGYELLDPDDLIRLYDLFPDELVSQYADSREAAETPGGYIGSVHGDNGCDATDDEAPF